MLSTANSKVLGLIYGKLGKIIGVVTLLSMSINKYNVRKQVGTPDQVCPTGIPNFQISDLNKIYIPTIPTELKFWLPKYFGPT
jgi:hypothetical protein